VRNTRLVVIVAVVAVFVVVGAVIAFRSTGGGGQARDYTLNVTGSTMKPDKMEARQGDTLTITVVADKDEEIHLHGYDVVFEGKAGERVTKTFKADKTGSFEIEIEDTSTHLGELDVT